MSRSEIAAGAICVFLTLAVIIGSTGWGYADYRPLRDYDIFSISVSWLGLAYYFFMNRRARQ